MYKYSDLSNTITCSREKRNL